MYIKKLVWLIVILITSQFILAQDRPEMEFDFFYTVANISGDVYPDPYGGRSGGGFEFGIGNQYKGLIGTYFTTPMDDKANTKYEGMFSAYFGVSYLPDKFKYNPLIKIYWSFISLYQSYPEDYSSDYESDFGSIYEITGTSIGFSVGYQHMFNSYFGIGANALINFNNYKDGDDSGGGTEYMVRIPEIVVKF
ncbi:MAG: hypothetical protein ISR95_00350 [Candidatus Marinimicrobia bacterium]|nr:hypothetical protein [Candidatus Neomarinimicrobiota bacterium]MBL7046081.1 hypothetical protein [Candidatus Neomarinimicrobiota bacterium]